jgi:hypothetical protein
VKTILFLTSTNLAANPRLVKELSLARTAGFDCTVVQFQVGNWSDQLTAELIADYPDVKFVRLSATRKPLIPWLLSTFMQFLYSRLPLFMISVPQLAIANGKRAWLLLQWLKKHSVQYQWVVAHNPPAFYPACYYAQKCGVALGVDIEDYHPGETCKPAAQKRMRTLMRRVLPYANYCSYASPLIAKEVQQDIPEMMNRQIILLNGFPKEEFLMPKINSEPILKIVWFSQHIASGRGLEQVFPVINKLYPKVELHLIGNINREFEEKFIQNKTGIFPLGILSQKELHHKLSEFDVGLATDLPVNRNREIALTNKIITYAQAGLVIAAMHTEAQDNFLQSGELQYVQMQNNPISIENAFLQLYHNKVSGKFNMLDQYQKAQQYCWEKISQPLKIIWEA